MKIPSSPAAKIAIIAFIILLSVAFNIKDSFQSYGFGAEYGNIAASLAKGNGYAQAFNGSEESTAWMLPFNTLIYTVIFVVFGVKSKVAVWACIVICCLLWSLSFFYLYKLSHFLMGKFAILSVPILCCFLWLNRTIVYNLDDIALINLLSLATVYYLYLYLLFNKKFKNVLFLAAVLPLVSPGLFLAFALILIVRFISMVLKRQQTFKSSIFFNPYSKIIYLGLASCLVITVWGYRNYLTLGVFIPSKSNFWYEFYQANMADEDGVLNMRTFKIFHPSNNGKYRDLYDNLGEIGFVEHMKKQALEEFELSIYLQKLGNRLQFAFLRSRNTNFSYPIDTTILNPVDKKLLYQEGLIENRHWIALDLDQRSFNEITDKLQLVNRQDILIDWKSKKKIYIQQIEKNPKYILRELSISLLPFLSILLGLSMKKLRKCPLFQIIIIIYFIQLLPYIMVSHYARYQYYLTTLQVLLVFTVTVSIVKLMYNRLSPLNLKLLSLR